MNFCLTKLKEKEQIKLKVSRGKEVIKIEGKSMEWKTRIKEKIIETKRFIYDKVDKIDKSLLRLIKKRRARETKKTQLANIMTELRILQI